MENNIQPEIIQFLDQYYCNQDVPEEAFMEAVRQKISQLADLDQQQKFMRQIIEQGKLIRDGMAQRIHEHEFYKLKGDEF